VRIKTKKDIIPSLFSTVFDLAEYQYLIDGFLAIGKAVCI
jgi:hypothetical protein